MRHKLDASQAGSFHGVVPSVPIITHIEYEIIVINSNKACIYTYTRVREKNH